MRAEADAHVNAGWHHPASTTGPSAPLGDSMYPERPSQRNLHRVIPPTDPTDDVAADPAAPAEPAAGGSTNVDAPVEAPEPPLQSCRG